MTCARHARAAFVGPGPARALALLASCAFNPRRQMPQRRPHEPSSCVVSGVPPMLVHHHLGICPCRYGEVGSVIALGNASIPVMHHIVTKEFEQKPGGGIKQVSPTSFGCDAWSLMLFSVRS